MFIRFSEDIMKQTVIALACSIALLSCAKQEKPQTLEPNPAAEVTSVTGDVRAFAHGEWSAAVVGTVLLATDSLDLPATAACELKDAGNRVAQLRGATKDDVAKLLEAGAPAKPAKPAKGAGKALATIKKLAAKQTTAAVTPTAVAGIRGTSGRKPMPPDTSKKDSTSHK